MAALGVTLASAGEASADAGAGANVSCGGVLLAFGDALAVALAFALPLAAATGADFMTDFIALLGRRCAMSPLARGRAVAVWLHEFGHFCSI